GGSGRVEESDRNLHPVALRAHHLGVLGGRAEAQAAVTAHLDAHVVDALRAGDQVLMVPELEDAVLVHELRCRDARAEDVGPAFGADLQEDILLLGVDVRHARAGEHGAPPQPQDLVVQAFWSSQSAAVMQGLQPAMAVLWQTPASQDSVVQAFWSSQSAAVMQGLQPAMAVLWQTPASQDSVVQAFWSSQSAAVVQGLRPASGVLWQTPASQDSVVQAFWSSQSAAVVQGLRPASGV